MNTPATRTTTYIASKFLRNTLDYWVIRRSLADNAIRDLAVAKT
ncbi:MAG: hypothetical protein ACI93R_004231 [Flavobacteriales bacterium]|jgi:hypothetical protein